MRYPFKMKVPNFFIYFNKHPCSVATQADLEESKEKSILRKNDKLPGKEVKDEVVFNLANHTIGQIDEEDE